MYDGLHPTVQNTRSPTCAIRTKRKKSKKAKKFFDQNMPTPRKRRRKKKVLPSFYVPTGAAASTGVGLLIAEAAAEAEAAEGGQ